jgi:hypothetical protein
VVQAVNLQQWVDRLEIRELIERSMRYLDYEAGARIAELFAEDGVLQVAPWCQRSRRRAAAHWSSNPVINVDGENATAETDMMVVKRDEAGRARITLLARYRDRLRRGETGWVIVNRTGVSIARAGEEGTDAEWARALERMPAQTRAQFRVT